MTVQRNAGSRMNKKGNTSQTPLWVLIAKGWFFGMLAITLPFLFLFAMSLPFVETESGSKEIIVALFFVPFILLLQGFLISLIVLFGLKIATLVGMQKK